MKYAEIEEAMIDRRAALANLRAANMRLDELGVKDVPKGDPVLPAKPSAEMIEAARKALNGLGFSIPNVAIDAALVAASAVAPKRDHVLATDEFVAKKCPYCSGRGVLGWATHNEVATPCRACHGAGYFQKGQEIPKPEDVQDALGYWAKVFN